MSRRKDRPKAPNGMGSIYQLPDGRWRVSIPTGWLPTGTAKRITRIFGTLKAAETWRMQTILDRDKGTLILPTDTTLSELIDQWDTRNTHWTHSTRRGNIEVLKTHTLHTLGKTKVADLKPGHIERLITYLRTERTEGAKTRPPLSDAGIARVLKRLRSLLAYAVQIELIHRNVAASIPLPRAEKTRHNRWTAEELAKVMQVLPGIPLGNYFHVALTTGLRKEELRGLRWQDVDLASQTLHVQHVVVDESGTLVAREKTKTDASNRIVHFDGGTQAALIRQLELQDGQKRDAGNRWKDQGLVFTMPHGAPLRDKLLRAALDDIQVAAKVSRIRLYDTRSTHGSLLAERGVNPKAISERLGHADVALTLNVYVRAQAKEDRDIAGIMAEMTPHVQPRATEPATLQPTEGAGVPREPNRAD